MDIKLVESGKKFSDEEVRELERFLLRLPASHLRSLEQIERVGSFDRAFADSSPRGRGQEIRLFDGFYALDPAQREYVFLHEMGHTYFDFIDETEGDRTMLKCGPCTREDVAHLLRVQWMELGLWELHPQNWERVKALNPANSANRDKYTYMVMYKNPNHEMGEWVCPVETRIPKRLSDYSFRYDTPAYSPKEEIADAYASFVLDTEHFLRATEANKAIRARYDFTQRHFNDASVGSINLVR